jgi:hypothetical protein
MKRLILVLVAIVTAFIVTTLGALLLILAAPTLEINLDQHSLVKRWIPHETLDFTTLQLTVNSQALMKKSLSIDARDLAVKAGGVSLRAAALAATAQLSWERGGLRLHEVGPIRAQQIDLVVKPEPAKEPEPATGDKLQQILDAIQRIRFAPIDLEAVRFAVQIGDNPAISGEGELHLTGLNRANADELSFEFRHLSPYNLRPLSGRIILANYQSLLDPKAVVSAEAFATLVEKGAATRFHVEVSKTAANQVVATAAMSKPGLRLDARFNGKLESPLLTGRFQAALAQKPGRGGNEARFESCRVRLDWKRWERRELSSDLACDGSVSYRQVVEGLTLSKILPNKLAFAVSSVSTLYLDKPAGNTLATQTLLQLKPPPHSSPEPLVLSGEARLTGALLLAQLKKSDLKLTFDLAAHADEFADIVGRLEKTQLAVPAPLNQLRGALGCNIKGLYDTFPPAGFAHPINCSVRLRSPQQTLAVDSSGSLEVTHQRGVLRPYLKTLITVHDLDFVLPRIELGGPMPRVTYDPRIVSQDPKKTAGGAAQLAYDIEVKTATPGAIRIHSNLLRRPVPLGLRTVFSTARPFEGKLTVTDYRLDVLRRNIEIQSIAMGLGPDLMSQPVTGVAKIDNNDYLITLTLGGTVGRPEYFLESRPYLPEKEILAVLLFGKEPEFLDPDKVQSVENTRAALADGMINLISMYYLASTPVESISYNPVSQSFSAKVNLARGTSLTVGTDPENLGEIGIRRNLGGGWSLETKAAIDEETGTNSGSAMLRWSTSY